MRDDNPLTNFIMDFVAEQKARDAETLRERERECATIIQGFQGTLIEALGVDTLDALRPEWGIQDALCPNYAFVVLHYKDEAYKLKDSPGFRLKSVQKAVAEFILKVDQEIAERVAERAKLVETLTTRPLPDHVTSSWWNRIQHIVGDDEALLKLWDAAMEIFDERVRAAKAQEEKRRQKALKASDEFMREVLADIENSDDYEHINTLSNDIPRTVVQEDRYAIREAACKRLQELDLEQERRETAKRERIFQLEAAAFWAFHFYEVHYQTGVLYEDGYPCVETTKTYCYSPECTQEGWWFTADGRRVRLPFVSKVVERCVSSPGDFWPRGMYKIETTDDGLEYRVPSPLATRADIE